jgi:CyaY protein
MTEQSFLSRCERLLETIEDALDGAGVDCDSMRTGHLLEIEFDDGAKIVVNGQAPLQEIWLADRSGGYHFRQSAGQWCDTRSGEKLSAVLSRCVSAHCATPVTLAID